jgi:hypothetical protein
MTDAHQAEFTHTVLYDVARARSDQWIKSNTDRPHMENPNTSWYYRLAALDESLSELKATFAATPGTQLPGTLMYADLIELAAIAVAAAEGLRATNRVGAEYPAQEFVETYHDTKGTGVMPEGHEFGALDSGWQTTPDAEARPHEEVLMRALTIHISRSKQYGQMWREYGWRGSLVHARSACERAWRMMQAHRGGVTETQRRKKTVDDLLDLINYAVFTIRNIEDGNAGTWEW